MNVLFLTLQYSLENEKDYLKKSKVALQAAANTFQNNLLSGFKDQSCKVTIMNSLPMATYPKYDQLVMKTERGRLLGFDNVEIGYINLPLVKQWSRYANYKKHVDKWIRETEGEKYVIAYSLYLPFEKVFKYIKKKYPQVKTGLICTDLPCEYGILPKNKLKAAVMYSYGRKLLKNTKYCDFFTVLTEDMKYPLNIGERKYTVVEGITNGQPITPLRADKKSILYTGTLNKQFGILTLLEAFSLIEDPEAELWICGGGDSKAAVEAAVAQDSRIKFFGFVSKDTVRELQQKAFMLINPRQNDGEYTKYSFPSKTMEYMLSGKPVLMYRLSGIPAEYDPYLFYIEGNSAEDMKNAILKIFEADGAQLAKQAEAAVRFVAQQKNPAVQAKKIIDLMERL